ncbi:hypothetical protein QE152_g32627 [Popillia japonica]|uniref:Uncharacterized protein n=1 Tax=Popillia japonica TaxID=7064 RepID=A0AAW1IYZ3_POPJA
MQNTSVEQKTMQNTTSESKQAKPDELRLGKGSEQKEIDGDVTTTDRAGVILSWPLGPRSAVNHHVTTTDRAGDQQTCRSGKKMKVLSVHSTGFAIDLIRELIWSGSFDE